MLKLSATFNQLHTCTHVYAIIQNTVIFICGSLRLILLITGILQIAKPYVLPLNECFDDVTGQARSRVSSYMISARECFTLMFIYLRPPLKQRAYRPVGMSSLERCPYFRGSFVHISV